MKICKGYGSTLFISNYDNQHNLTLKLTNVIARDDGVLNRPVDFLETGLAPKDCPDEWTGSQILSINTDEAVPPRINGIAIGGNHGHPCAIDVLHYGHGKTCRDVGSVWVDDAGVTFYLVQVPNDDQLTFVSENVGESIDKYDFVLKITGKLKYVRNGQSTCDVLPAEQIMKYLTPAIKHQQIDFFALQNGQKKRVITSVEADLAQIREVYDVINPATVGPALEKARPNGGFDSMPVISNYGEKMLNVDCKHCVLDDGTYINDFKVEKLSNVHFNSYMGAMCQERRDFFGGGVFRYMPKTLPFITDEGSFDFTTPKNLKSQFPKKHLLTKDSWANPDNPPNRFIDILRDKDGHNKMGFATGYLPLYDGEPEIRKQNLSHAIDIRTSLKLYPVFKDGDLDCARGVAYKKYFKIEKDGAYSYEITYEGVRYVYCDFFAKDSLEFTALGKVSILEISNDICIENINGKIAITSNSDTPQYAVLKEVL